MWDAVLLELWALLHAALTPLLHAGAVRQVWRLHKPGGLTCCCHSALQVSLVCTNT